MYLIILDNISFLENISKRARRILYGKVDNKPIIWKGWLLTGWLSTWSTS